LYKIHFNIESVYVPKVYRLIQNLFVYIRNLFQNDNTISCNKILEYPYIFWFRIFNYFHYYIDIYLLMIKEIFRIIMKNRILKLHTIIERYSNWKQFSY